MGIDFIDKPINEAKRKAEELGARTVGRGLGLLSFGGPTSTESLEADDQEAENLLA
jgi:hypothetical protein